MSAKITPLRQKSRAQRSARELRGGERNKKPAMHWRLWVLFLLLLAVAASCRWHLPNPGEPIAPAKQSSQVLESR